MDDLIGGAIGLVGWACCGLLKCMMHNCDKIHVNCSCPTSAFGACFSSCCSHVWRCMSTISPCACCKQNAGEAYNACRLCCHARCVMYCCACDRTCCICCDLCCPSVQLFGGGRGNNGNNGNHGHGNHGHGNAHGHGHSNMGTGGTLILIDGGGTSGGSGGNNGKAGPSQQEMDEQKRQRKQQQDMHQQRAYSPGHSPLYSPGMGNGQPQGQPMFVQQQQHQGPQSPSFFQPQQQPMPPAVVEAQFESFSPQPLYVQQQPVIMMVPAPQAQAAW